MLVNDPNEEEEGAAEVPPFPSLYELLEETQPDLSERAFAEPKQSTVSETVNNEALQQTQNSEENNKNNQLINGLLQRLRANRGSFSETHEGLTFKF